MKANQEQISRLVKTARGQLDGVLRMVDEDRYCLDIVNQLSAAQALLQKANREILRAHMECCVRDALAGENADQKVDELVSLLERMTR